MERYKQAVIGVAGLFLWISATLTNGPNLYFMSAVILVLPAVSYLFGLLASRDLAPRRLVPTTAWEGETVTFSVIVRGSPWIPRAAVWARDQLPQWIRLVPGSPRVAAGPSPGEVEIRYDVELLKRGAYALDALTVVVQDPLGIFSFKRRFQTEAEIVVYPVVRAAAELALGGADRYGFRDVSAVVVHGEGVTPDGIREYVPGDPLRRVHWKATARTGRLTVIEFEEPHAVNVVFALDLDAAAHAGAGKETTLEHLISACASLASEAVAHGAEVQLVMGSSPSASEVPGRGTVHFMNILAGLARAEADDHRPISTRMPERVGVLRAGTTLVVLTPSTDGALPGVLAHYTGAGCQVTVVYASASEYGNGPSRASVREAERAMLGGLESAGVTVVRLSPHRERGPGVRIVAGQ